MKCNEILDRLDPYRDGELPIAERRAIDEHLAGCASCRAELTARGALSRAVGAAGGFVAPPALRQRVVARLRAEPPVARGLFSLPTGWRHAAASIVALAAAAGLGALIALSLSAGAPARDWALREALSAHLRSLLEQNLLHVASTDPHSVRPWFSGKLDYAPPVLDFSQEGFPLIGGRLDYLNDRPTMALVYGRRKHRINLFVWPANAAPLDDASENRQGFHVIAWRDAVFAYVAVSDLQPLELESFVRLMRARAAPS